MIVAESAPCEVLVGEGVVLAYFVLPAPAVVWVIGPLNCGIGQSVFRFRFLFRPADSPPLGTGADLGYFGYSDCGTGLCDFLCSLF